MNNNHPMHEIKGGASVQHEVSICDKPCSEFIQAARLHTEQLIKIGLARDD